MRTLTVTPDQFSSSTPHFPTSRLKTSHVLPEKQSDTHSSRVKLFGEIREKGNYELSSLGGKLFCKEITHFLKWCCLVAKSCLTLEIPWTVAHQASLSMEFSRQEYWNGWPFPPSGALPDPGIKPWSPALQADSLLSEPSGKPLLWKRCFNYIESCSQLIVELLLSLRKTCWSCYTFCSLSSLFRLKENYFASVVSNTA